MRLEIPLPEAQLCAPLWQRIWAWRPGAGKLRVIVPPEPHELETLARYVETLFRTL